MCNVSFNVSFDVSLDVSFIVSFIVFVFVFFNVSFDVSFIVSVIVSFNVSCNVSCHVTVRMIWIVHCHGMPFVDSSRFDLCTSFYVVINVSISIRQVQKSCWCIIWCIVQCIIWCMFGKCKDVVKHIARRWHQTSIILCL